MNNETIVGAIIGLWIWAALFALIVWHNAENTRYEAVLTLLLFCVSLGASIGWMAS